MVTSEFFSPHNMPTLAYFPPPKKIVVCNICKLQLHLLLLLGCENLERKKKQLLLGEQNLKFKLLLSCYVVRLQNN
jgi:hypothetical protein